MRYMYTTKPDEGCHEVEPGIYGRPVQTCNETKLRKQGWSFSVDSLRGTDYVRQEKEGREEGKEVNDETMSIDDRVYLEAVEEYRNKFGKSPHHKMKTETILRKLEEPDD